MKFLQQEPKRTLKAFLKQPPFRSEMDLFKKNLIALLDCIDENETEEHLKNQITHFLRDTYYKDTHLINTKDKKDLVIHLGKTNKHDVGVVIEAKRPRKNESEMITADDPNKKALHELILYYLDERNKVGNGQLKQLVITNVYEWYIIDANQFDKYIYRNPEIIKLYETKINDKKDNPFFYEEVAKIIPKIDAEIPCTYFDIRKYDAKLRNNNKDDDRDLSALLKILSPQHLLKIDAANDSNSLDEKFYKELLHIIGLEEAKEGGKNIIRRKKENRNPASFIENTIEALIAEDPLHHLPDQTIYGETREDRLYNIALELCITWINRILFLKLLEGQLITYHQGNKDYRFLNTETVPDFRELFTLFHSVLAVNVTDRSDANKTKYSLVPYLNSSLFDIEQDGLEDLTINIKSLDNNGHLELINTTILKDAKKRTGKLPPLDYLFQFLNAYNFASDGTAEVQEEKKTIINASVLGKVFEKINGYKDGSIFTPGFITMYMCKQSIRLAVVEKFNEALSEEGERKFDKLEDVKIYTSRHYKTEDVLKANEIINSLRICDPAVGSGHFLVSALNEIISIKSELGILADKKGDPISGYEIEILNDELIITDTQVLPFEYQLNNGKPFGKTQELQKTLFHEKETIIEKCLFGVDINPNSVKICRLRLWIELLKNAYYKEDTNFLELETLPNIDINIKCGNSLISRFALKADVFERIPNFKQKLNEYKFWVDEYKNTKDRNLKTQLTKSIRVFTGEFKKRDPKVVKLQKDLEKRYSEFYEKFVTQKLFAETANPDVLKKKEKLETEIEKLSNEIEKQKTNNIYKNAFEWRFEFPEVLNNNGEFEGFDIIIANPPYIQHRELAHFSTNLRDSFEVYSGTADISSYFFERALKVLKPKGILSFINSNKFFNAEYGKPLRTFLSRYNFKAIVNFEQVPIFDEALVSSAIFILTNEEPVEPFKYFKYFKEKVISLDDTNELLKRLTEINYNELKVKSWLFNDNSSSNIINKIKSKGKLLSEIDTLDIKRGITTGFDDAFILDDNDKNKLLENELQYRKVIKPLLRGKDINKYTIKASRLNLLFVPWHFPLHKDETINGSSEVAEMELKKNFPLLYKHLFSYKEKLSNRNKAETGIRYEWYALQRCANTYYKDFNKPKIIWGLISGNWGFALDDENHFLTSASFFMTSKIIPLKFLLALFNSELYRYYFTKVGEYTAGGAYVLKKTSIEKLVVPAINNKEQQPFIDLVDKIIAQKQQGQDSTENEKAIDELVYKLYELTPEEIAIIESETK